ncbi:MAG TPA: hypothetical protein VNJ54_11035 [Plantibacter sp.]|uniref:hypothetical protein n=1 Tax=unclassified Plantibacter TaxID=2624265 RepID=UPI002B98D9A7|nr:hypothetical protein [Plantibacter sp.]
MNVLDAPAPQITRILIEPSPEVPTAYRTIFPSGPPDHHHKLFRPGGKVAERPQAGAEDG